MLDLEPSTTEVLKEVELEMGLTPFLAGLRVLVVWEGNWDDLEFWSRSLAWW